MGPYRVKILEAVLPTPLDPEEVAKTARRSGTIIIGLNRSLSPCMVASAALHADELVETGVLRVRSRPLAVLMLLYGAKQISDLLEKLASVERVVGVNVDPRVFESSLRALTGIIWRGRECRVECRPGDLAGVAEMSASML